MARRDLSGVVDFSVLERFAAHDDAVIEEVLNLFREQAQMWSRLLKPSGAAWRDAAHTVKGAASGIGAIELADACEAAEASPDELSAPALARAAGAVDGPIADVAAHAGQELAHALPEASRAATECGARGSPEH